MRKKTLFSKLNEHELCHQVKKPRKADSIQARLFIRQVKKKFRPRKGPGNCYCEAEVTVGPQYSECAARRGEPINAQAVGSLTWRMLTYANHLAKSLAYWAATKQTGGAAQWLGAQIPKLTCLALNPGSATSYLHDPSHWLQHSFEGCHENHTI